MLAIRLRRLILVIGVLCTAAPAGLRAQDAPTVPGAGEVPAADAALTVGLDNVDDLRSRLQIRELEIRRLREQVAALRKDIEDLRIENAAYKLALQTLREKPIIVQVQAGENGAPMVARPAEPGDGAAEADPQAAKPIDSPRQSIQYSLHLIDRGGNYRRVYRNEDGYVTLRDVRDYDRSHVVVRGNLKNESAAAYRYSFEIRLATRNKDIIGSWRYQTPVLTPGQIHQFEVKVPVTNAAQIQIYDIGNIVADRPDEAKALNEAARNEDEGGNVE